MKEIPWWVWLLVAGGGIYLLTRSSGTFAAGSQIYVPQSTPLFSDSGLTQSAGITTGQAGIYTVVSSSGNAVQINMYGQTYWMNASAAATPTASQISASSAGTLT